MLLGGFALRVAYFGEVPPGVSHDEVFDWYNSELVAQGDLRALYPYGGGRENLYMFLVSLTFHTMGSNLVGVRFPALLIAMLGLATTYAITRRLLGRFTAIFASAGLATAYWALTFSRLGERTGSAPMIGLLFFYVFLRLILHNPKPALWHVVVTGILFAASLYTYPAALMLPGILVGWLIVLALGRREWLSGKVPSLLLIFAIFAVLAFPLARAWSQPTSTIRANAVNAPLKALLSGDPSLVLQNVLPVLGMLSIQGDTGTDVNGEGLPIIPTFLLAALFYVGVLIILFRVFQVKDWRWPGYTLVLIWLPAMMVPTLVTQRPVNTSRPIGMLAVVFIVPAIALAAGYELASRRRQRSLAYGTLAVGMLAILMQLYHTAVNYYTIWPQHPLVQFWYQDFYTDIAADLNASPERPVLAMGGLNPYVMDAGSMILLLHDDQYAESMGYFDPQTSLLLPYSQGSSPEIIIPKVAPLHHALAERLPEWEFELVGDFPEYVRYTGPAEGFSRYTALPEPISFFRAGSSAGEALIYLLGTDTAGQPAPGQAFTLLTIWRTENRSNPDELLRVFVHLVTADGTLLAQSDVMGVPAPQWRRGDVIIQAHDFTLPPDAAPGPYLLRIGIYDPVTGPRLVTPASTTDHVLLEIR